MKQFHKSLILKQTVRFKDVEKEGRYWQKISYEKLKFNLRKMTFLVFDLSTGDRGRIRTHVFHYWVNCSTIGQPEIEL